MKKLLCILLAALLCTLAATPNGAEATLQEVLVSPEICSAISNELSLYEQEKSFIGMDNVDFASLYIGDEVYVYEYTATGFKEIAKAYLLFEDKQIVSLAYNIADAQFQFMPTLANSIKQTSVDVLALIYDVDGCYLYNGLEFIPLGYTGMTIAGRAPISEAKEDEVAGLILSNLYDKQYLNFTSNSINTRIQTNYSYSVAYVTQLPYDRICWAATIASIQNYLNGTTLSAVDVAQARYGSTNFNEGIFDFDAAYFMNSRYNLGYTYGNYVPSENILVGNIKNGFPIYGTFAYTDGRHAVTVYGVNVIAGRILIMDPEFGSATCYNGANGYTYVSSYSGLTLTFDSAICKTW